MKHHLTQTLPPLVVFLAALLLWETAVWLFQIEQFLLPAPSVIGRAFIENFERLVAIGWFTTKEALGGFAIGCSWGIVVALITIRFPLAKEALLPFAIAANSVPILAFAPILNNWFGVDNPLSKMMIAAVIVFFPTMINGVRGLLAVDPAALELMRACAASEWQILWRLRWPNALPYLFNAFKLAAALSMVGAVVGEFFGGNRAALGVFITQEAAKFRFDLSWAAILVACIIGITLYRIITTIERWVIPWHVSVRGE